jgi:hypothetical protein
MANPLAPANAAKHTIAKAVIRNRRHGLAEQAAKSLIVLLVVDAGHKPSLSSGNFSRMR